MTDTEKGKRELMHARVVRAVELGLPRSEAFVAVGSALDLRAGHVAASYWRVERERENRTPVGAPDSDRKQLDLGGRA